MLIVRLLPETTKPSVVMMGVPAGVREVRDAGHGPGIAAAAQTVAGDDLALGLPVPHHRGRLPAPIRRPVRPHRPAG